MARMTAADAAVAILKREGVTHAFGVPGAAINPFYAALQGAHGGINHTLARHVEGASHMAEGYTRAQRRQHRRLHRHLRPGRHRHDHRPVLRHRPTRSRSCASPARRRSRVLHKEDFQAVDIASIAKPVTKMAITVLEAAQVPGVFQQAFHLMRSGRPGPVLIDLPIDVQLTEIEFDLETYEPLPVYKPAATRAQVEKALDMLQRGRAPADRRRRRHHQRRRLRPAGRVRRADSASRSSRP